MVLGIEFRGFAFRVLGFKLRASLQSQWAEILGDFQSIAATWGSGGLTVWTAEP